MYDDTEDVVYRVNDSVDVDKFNSDGLRVVVSLEKGVKDYVQGFNPSAFICASHDGVVPCNMEISTHYLATIIKMSLPRNMNATFMNVPLGTRVVAACLVRRDAKSAYLYISNTNPMVATNKTIRAWANAAFTGLYDHYHNLPDKQINLWIKLDCREGNYAHSKDYGVTIRQLIAREWPKEKITANHNVHYTFKEIALATNLVKNTIIHPTIVKAANMANATDAFLAGVCLWLSSLDLRLLQYVVRSNLWRCSSLEKYFNKAKLLSNRMKNFQGISEDDLRPLFEMEVLINRGYGAIDWEVEEENRTAPQTVNIHPSVVQAHAEELFRRADGVDGPEPIEWEDFWNTRWQHTPTGSVHTQHIEDQQYIYRERELKNKFITLGNMNTGFDYWVDRDPEIHAWASIKWEWAKLRAIYGTDLTSYVIATYGLSKCERSLPDEFPVGVNASEKFVKRAVADVLNNRVPFCFDYEDFNSQHSIDSMRAVIMAYYRVVGPRLTEEQRTAILWTLKSFEHIRVHNNIIDREYDAVATLVSGHRLTTFLNSVLNKIYLKEAGLDGITSLHNGDDALLGIYNLQDAINVKRGAEGIGVRMQKHKCYVFSMSEFLRVDRNVEGNGQYLTRGIATLLQSQPESSLPTTLTTAIENNETRLREAIARGMINITGKMRFIYGRRISKIYKSEDEIYFEILHAHRVVGGLATNLDAPIEYEYIELDDFDAKRAAKEKFTKKFYSSADLGRVLSARLGFAYRSAEVAERLYNATIASTTFTRKRVVKQEIEHPRKYSTMKGLYKMFNRFAQSSVLGQSKLAGLTLNVIAGSVDYILLKSFLSTVHDPSEIMTWLNIVV